MRCFEVFMKYTSGRSVSVSPRKNLTTWVQPPLLDAKTSGKRRECFLIGNGHSAVGECDASGGVHRILAS